MDYSSFQIHPIHNPVRDPLESQAEYRQRRIRSKRIVSQYIRYRGRDAIEIQALKDLKHGAQ